MHAKKYFIVVALIVGLGMDMGLAQSATNIVAFGDSLTAGISSDSPPGPYPEALQKLLGEPAVVLNKGKTSDSTLHLFLRFTNDVMQATFPNGRPADHILILAGVNDIALWQAAADVSNDLYAPTEAISRLRELARASAAAGMRPVVMTFWPDTDFTKSQLSGIATVNRWILRDLTNEVAGAIACDMALAITGQPGPEAATIRPEYDDGGGLHLNRAGYQKMAETLAKVLRPNARRRN